MKYLLRSSLRDLQIIPVLFVLLCIGCAEKTPPVQQVPGISVPEGFVVEEAVPSELLSFPMFATFDDNGRLFVFESTEPNTMDTEDMLENPSYHIRMLEDTDRDGVYDTSTVFADNIPLPMGGSFYRGSLYIAAPPNLERLTDTDGDGIADEREVILTGWTLNVNAATLSGPFIGPDGWLYMADARRGFEIETKEGEVLKGAGTRIWRCLPDGSRLESYSGGGFDNAVEIAFTPSGETIGTMTYFTDPQDGQRDALMHWVEGGVYPKPHKVIEDDQLKLTGELMPTMSKFPRVAPSGLMRFRGHAFGDDYEGNLFSAQFNTGRIMRHQMNEAGATFSTQDEPFMTSESSDSHPTDVLQDADGSLLVVITGGWFIKGCPLSQVAKPDVPGVVYRIRKLDAPEVEDPRGLDLNWEEMSAGDLVSYLSDERFVVRDKAIEALVLMGEAAVADLTDALDADDERLRTDAVFALYRINTETSIEGVRSALEDPSPMVRTAAVRVLGLEKDSLSLEKIMELAKNDQAGVRRQAATALGQLGDQRAVPALLTAAEDPGDRFVEHAIIHSLTLLKAPQPLLEALEQGSANVKKAAVIALDQMDGSPLRQEHLAEFLQSGDKTLRSTGIWLAGHHPEWADVVVDFFRNSLAGLEGSEEDLAEVEDLMVTFSTDRRMQQFIAAELANSATPESRKLMLMGVIRRSPLEELPNLWIQPLSRLLSGGEERVRSGILDLIGSRNIVAMEKQVNQIIHDPATPADFRLKALNARILIRPQLSGEEFAMVLGFMSSEHDSPVRQSASRLLARAELDDAQLLELANNEIQNADLFLLPSLVDAFQGNKTPEVGEALIQALNNSTDRLDNLSEQDLRSLFDSFPEPVQASAEPLLATLHQRHADRLARLQELEDKLGNGDVGEGRKLFFGKSACSTCHAVGPEGGDFGPDLTNIGEIRSRHDILEAIVYPNASFAREYETFRVVTNNNTYTGVIAEQYPDAILVTIGPGPGIRIPRTDIVEIEPHGVSMMPPGLDQQLTEEEMSDLVAFLEALPYTVDRIIEARRD